VSAFAKVFAREVAAGGDGLDVCGAAGAGVGFSDSTGWLADGLFFSLIFLLLNLVVLVQVRYVAEH
jgi:hypothetical protein